jgi:predicted nucleic acid-binding protein
MSVYVDTSVWFAAANIKDAHNAHAKQLLAGTPTRLTSDHVVVETWLLLLRRIHMKAAEGFWAGIRQGAAEIVTVMPVDLDLAWGITRVFPDQKFSIVDRTSFAVMERLGLSRVASFDDDFAIYRYGRNRERAFEVLR